jgi:hypothetical protein
MSYKKTLACLTIGVCSAIALTSATYAAFPRTEVTFEKEILTAEGQLGTDWFQNIWEKEKGQATITIVDEDAHSGKKSLKIENKIAGDSRLVYTPALTTPGIYKLSAWVKANIPNQEKAGAILSILGQTEKTANTPANEWTLVELYTDVKTIPTKEPLRFSIGVGGYNELNVGVAYFDDVTFEQVDALPQDTTAKVITIGNTVSDTVANTVKNVGTTLGIEEMKQMNMSAGATKKNTEDYTFILVLLGIIALLGAYIFYLHQKIKKMSATLVQKTAIVPDTHKKG